MKINVNDDTFLDYLDDVDHWSVLLFVQSQPHPVGIIVNKVIPTHPEGTHIPTGHRVC